MTKSPIACGWVACSMAAMFFAGCAGGDTAPKVSPKADVAGTVTVDGKPMDNPDSEILFSVAGEAPSILPVKDGKFEGKAAVGSSRVEIRSYRQGQPVMMGDKPVEGSGRENIIAEQFNDQSTLTATVPAAGVKDLKFEVQSKK